VNCWTSSADLVEFPLPAGLVAASSSRSGSRSDEARKAGRLDPEDAGKDEEALKATIVASPSRVRLRLLLGEIAAGINNIVVNDDELKRAMYA